MKLMLTPREKFIRALCRQPISGRVPHFELEFFLTMEAFGKVHPHHRNYHQWNQMKPNERQLHREDIAGVYLSSADRFEYSAILFHPNPYTEDELIRLLDILRDKAGNKYFLMVHGDATLSIPPGEQMVAFSMRLADEPQQVKSECQQAVDHRLEFAERLAKHGGLDGFALCSDYCFNSGPFLSPSQFSEFVTPYLCQLIAGYRSLGFYTIKHTDGNILPIIDQLLQAKPDALHSLDPQGGVDIAEIKQKYGHQVCLIGNVNCGLMDTGTDEEIVASARYALKHGMPGGGYVFSTSNCIYTGMPLRSYELILDVWRKEGNYPDGSCLLTYTEANSR